MNKIERRFIKGAEVRASKDEKPAISGYAAVFGEEYVLYDSASYRVVERIKKGAFAKVLDENQDVRCLFNHNPDHVLGRSTNGTLRMKQDDKGLQFENDLDTRTVTAQNVQAYIDRGDVSGCSFAFTVSKQRWTEEESDGKTISTRTIEEFKELYDVGPVTYPAYSATSVDARSAWLEEAPAELRAKVRANDNVDSCECDCAECAEGDCADCSDPDCEDPNCDHGDRCDRSEILEDVDTRMRLSGLKAKA